MFGQKRSRGAASTATTAIPLAPVAAIETRAPLRAAFFGYSWQANGELDGYMAESIDGIRKLGVDVDLYLGNYFTARAGVKGFRADMSLVRLLRHIRDQCYDFAISFNNSLLMPEIIDVLPCRPVSVIVDTEQHLFDHNDRGGYSAFKLDVAIAPIYSWLSEAVARDLPEALDRIQFIPPATNAAGSYQIRSSNAPTTNICWIASLVADTDLDRLTQHLTRSTTDAHEILRCLKRISRYGYLDELRTDPSILSIATQIGWDIDLLERQLQNIVTNDERIRTVDILAKRGLRLYGNDRWAALLPYSLSVAQSLAIGERVSSYQRLMDIYNTSRLSVNVPQIQAMSGIQYRVIDIMGSKSLLINKYVKNSDLFKIFGKDCPVPQFKSMEELGKLVDHFLKKENQRRDLVKRCNELVREGFSFVDRATTYLHLSNSVAASSLLKYNNDASRNSELGALNRVDNGHFINWTGRR